MLVERRNAIRYNWDILKHQSDKADLIIERTNHRKIDRNTAEFLNVVAKLDLEYDEEEGDVDMCLAMEKRYQKEKIEGVIAGMRIAGMDDKDIVSKIIESFNVTKEYVTELLISKTA